MISRFLCYIFTIHSLRLNQGIVFKLLYLFTFSSKNRFQKFLCQVHSSSTEKYFIARVNTNFSWVIGKRSAIPFGTSCWSTIHSSWFSRDLTEFLHCHFFDNYSFIFLVFCQPFCALIKLCIWTNWSYASWEIVEKEVL